MNSLLVIESSSLFRHRAAAISSIPRQGRGRDRINARTLLFTRQGSAEAPASSSDGPAQDGMTDLRGDLGQGHEDEVPQMEPGMRNDELRVNR